MEYLIGAVLATVVGVFAMVVGFDRDRAFYSTVLCVVGTYYVLYAVIGASTPVLIIESVVSCAFMTLAAVGFKRNMWVVVAGLAGHGVFDVFHHFVIQNPGVPVFWPGFCMAYDVVAGVFLALLLAKRAKA